MSVQIIKTKDESATAVLRRINSDVCGFGKSKGRSSWSTPTPETHHIEFTGIGDMVRVAMEGANSGLYEFDFFDDADWIGRKFASFDDIRAAVDGTWAYGVDTVEEMSRELEREELPRPTVIKRRRVWDDYAGDEIDVDRYRSADPFFRTNSRVSTPGPRLITFLVQLGANAFMDSLALFWRGALATTLARIVEDAGYRTEIVGFTMNEHTTTNPQCGNTVTTFRLKEAGDMLDVGSLVNATSGWFFRTVTFAAWTVPGERLNYGLGHMVEATPEIVEYIAPNARPWLISGVYNKAAALALAREKLATLVHESR